MSMTWQYKTGRDSDGDKFSVHILVAYNGRILARLWTPLNADEFTYKVNFRCRVPDTIIASDDYEHEFVSLEQAKLFIEETLSRFDPMAPPIKKDVAK